MAGGKSGYNHGGGAGKNIVLLLRAFVNIIAFGALWFGIAKSGTDISLVCTITGGILLAVCVWVNLISPFIHRVK